MTPKTLDLFRAVVDADVSAVRRALAQGADVNAIDGKGRNVVSHAALGDAIDAIDAPVQPRLSEGRLEILQLVLAHPDLSLYSLNAPLSWAGGVTLLGLMSWLNMPTEIMFLLEYTQGLAEVNAMDEQGATPLMYAARDGSLEVVQRLLAHGARPDLRDTSQRSAIQYALPHPQILWLCEDAVRRERAIQSQRSSNRASLVDNGATYSTISLSVYQNMDLFLATSIDTLLKPPAPSHFDSADLHRTFDALLRATRSGDDVALHALLFPAQLENSRTTSLINLRDSSGLSLVHHAVSQRQYSDGVVDALYRAGADVGLFSTLGFSPLHHLARTARDPPADEHGEPSETHSLYTFTIHLLRDLRAPLAATDAKGETPLHAAAEHGNSRLVLQAMLDYDGMYSRMESVREMRNERGSRPIDVCKPEFLSIFTQESARISMRLRTQASWDSSLSRDHVKLPAAHVRRNVLSSAGRPRSAGRLTDARGPIGLTRDLLAKASDASLQSRSSGSSSASSNPRYYTRSRKSGKSATPPHSFTLPTPSPTSTSMSDVADTRPSFDVWAYTRDLLSNLSICASALQGHTESQSGTYETKYEDLPDLHALSEAILSTRDMAALVFEHWTSRLDLARTEFERARKELEKTQFLREQVYLEAGAAVEGGVNSGDRAPGETLEPKGVNASSVSTAVQTEVSAVHVAHRETLARLEQEVASRAERVSAYTHLESDRLKEPATPERVAEMLHLMRDRRAEETRLWDAEDEVRLTRWYAESASRGEPIGASLLLGWVRVGSLPPLEVVREIESTDQLMVQREVRIRPASAKGAPKEGSVRRRAVSLPEATPRNAPLVLQRTEKDLNGVIAQLAQVTQSFVRAQQSVADASALVEQAFKVREDRLQALAGIPLNTPHPPSSFRHPRVQQRPIDATPGIPPLPVPLPAHQQLPPSNTASVHYRNISSGLSLEEPETLRRLLTRKIEKQLENVFRQLQKAHVWLRIIREVLRGLRRRIVSLDH